MASSMSWISRMSACEPASRMRCMTSTARSRRLWCWQCARADTRTWRRCWICAVLTSTSLVNHQPGTWQLWSVTHKWSQSWGKVVWRPKREIGENSNKNLRLLWMRSTTLRRSLIGVAASNGYRLFSNFRRKNSILSRNKARGLDSSQVALWSFMWMEVFGSRKTKCGPS